MAETLMGIDAAAVYPLSEAAARLPSPCGGSLNPQTLRGLARKGEVKGFRRGKYWFFRGADLLAYTAGEGPPGGPAGARPVEDVDLDLEKDRRRMGR